MWLGMIDVLHKGDVGKNVLPQCCPITYTSTIQVKRAKFDILLAP